MSAPYFSVIMPVYGVEKYLRDTLDSVLRQTFADFELILVDDCSKDGSGKIELTYTFLTSASSSTFCCSAALAATRLS